MRREDISQHNYIDYLISIGCRNWLPLQEDLTCKITNVTATVRDSIGSFDSDNGLLFTGAGGLYLSDSNFQWLGWSQSFTALIDFYMTERPSNNYGDPFHFCVPDTEQANRRKGLNINYRDGTTNQVYASMNNGAWTNSIGESNLLVAHQYNKYGVVYYGDTHRFSIVQGTISNTWNTNNNGWDSNAKTLFIGRGWSADPFYGYLRNFYLFDRVLTDDIINQLI